MRGLREPAELRNVRQFRRGLEAARRGPSHVRQQNESRVWEEFNDALANGEITGDDYSFRAMFEELVPDGRELLGYMSNAGDWQRVCQRIGEADGIKSSDFADFTYAVLSNETLKGYESPAYIGDRLVTKVKTKLKTERIGEITGFGDEAVQVPELGPIPLAGLSTNYIDTPETKKYGLGTAVSREAVFFDRLGQVLSEARTVGETLGLKREKRILRVILGLDNPWMPKDSHLSKNTYQTGGAGEAFDNVNASNPFVDWTSMRTAFRVFEEMTDPRTGEPIVLPMPRQILCSEYLSWGIRNMVGANQVNFRTGTNAGAEANYETTGPNPIKGAADVLTSPYVSDLLGNETSWFFGSFPRSFMYMENWPMQTVQVAVNGWYMAQHDIVMAVFSTEMGTPAVKDPRYVSRNDA